jgi:biotin carboxylase
MSTVPCAAIVDPFASGVLFAPELARRGWGAVAVHGNPAVAAHIRATARRGDFLAAVEHEGDIERTAGWLRSHGVALVLAGCETGVNLADALAETLGLPGNGTAMSAARRHKYLMAEAAGAWGVRVPRQRCSGELGELLAWVDRGPGYPVVAKPPHSLASESVRPCRAPAQLAAACAAILGRRNQCGLLNEEVLVQELVDGTQYAVDTVSRDGRHLLAGVWRYHRPPRRGLIDWHDEESGLAAYAAIGSDGKRMVAGGEPVAQRLFAFVEEVLDALAIRNGPAHCEVLVAADGPVLVEIGARMHGGTRTPVISRFCTGSSQLDRTLEAFLEPARFEGGAEQPYTLSQHGAMAYLTPWRVGTFGGFRRFGEVAALPSFHEAFELLRPGDPVTGAVGLVSLIHPDPAVVDRDVERIYELERQGLYELAEVAVG